MRLQAGSRKGAQCEVAKRKSPCGDFLVCMAVNRKSDANNIVGSFPFLFNLELEPDVVALGKHITKARILHVALMKKDLVASIGNDESKTLRHIEKLHGPVYHDFSSSRYQMNTKKNPSRGSLTGVFAEV
jgi:hypothetical protein